MRRATEERASKTCQENIESKLLYCNVQGTVCIFFSFRSFITKRSTVNYTLHISGRNIPPI